ncbi:hypothetical protein [Nocardia grenadensis]|uniref:hypothetical protein n=1 Tax=Nocardia grenadensis TaxID=931537 RepID=UPI00157CF38F|nr:hypothetical protein [Nocardia grenadensis]
MQVAHSRLAHQYDPALVEALSERELADDRRVAERVRDHSRRETEQRLEAAESAADQVRRATAEIVRADAQDLVTARKALAEQRRQSSPHAQLASLYRIKTFSSRALSGVVIAAMLWSAVNVQQNIAPTGAADPLFWASYLLEALISTVLVVFMVSGSAVARWKITEGDDLIKRIEIALLVATITLNTYPYFDPFKIWDIVVHAVAPVMIGVALFGHNAVSKRLGAAIDEASRQLPPDDDIAVRLAVLTDVTRPVPSVASPAPAEPAREPIAAAAPIMRDETIDRARTVPADGESDRAPIARGDDRSRAQDGEPIARDEDDSEGPIAREETLDRARSDGTDTTERRAPRADHIPADLGTDRAPIADRDHTGEDSEPDTAREEAPVVSLVRSSDRAPIAREMHPSIARSPRTDRARSTNDPATHGALARAADRAPRALNAEVPIARGDAGKGVDRGPFPEELSPAQALDFARAVVDRGFSKQPTAVLARIFEARSKGYKPNYIGKEIVDLPHSTVGRALTAVEKVTGPRAIN